jgi:hypothetical protein
LIATKTLLGAIFSQNARGGQGEIKMERSGMVCVEVIQAEKALIFGAIKEGSIPHQQ